MTLDDLEQQNKGFIDFRFCDFGRYAHVMSMA